VNISAATGGSHVDSSWPAIEPSGADAAWETRISTGMLNAWLDELVAATPLRAGWPSAEDPLAYAGRHRPPPFSVSVHIGFFPEAGVPRVHRTAAPLRSSVRRSPVQRVDRLRREKPGGSRGGRRGGASSRFGRERRRSGRGGLIGAPPEDCFPADLTELDRARVWHTYAPWPGASAPLVWNLSWRSAPARRAAVGHHDWWSGMSFVVGRDPRLTATRCSTRLRSRSSPR